MLQCFDRCFAKDSVPIALGVRDSQISGCFAGIMLLFIISAALFTPGMHGDPNLLNFLISPDLNEAKNEGREHLTTMTVDLNGNSFQNCYSRQLGRWISFSIGDGNYCSK